MLTSYFVTYYVIAIAAMSYLLYFAKKKTSSSRFFLPMITSIICLMLSQTLCIIAPASQELILDILIRLFYAVCFVSSACILSHALAVLKVEEISFLPKIESSVWFLALFGLILSLASDEIVSGYTFRTTVGITATKGDLYWIFLLQTMLVLIASFGAALWKSLNPSDMANKPFIRSVLLAYALLLMGCLIMLFAFRYGLLTSVPLLYPLVISLFAIVLIIGELRHQKLSAKEDLLNAGSSLPQNLTTDELLSETLSGYKNGKYTLTQAMERFDYMLVSYTYNKHNGNMSHTAKATGLGRSTLYKKVQKHNLKTKDK